MAYELGKDWKLYVGDGGGTEVFTALGGEGSLDWSRTSDNIDLTSKDSSTYKLGTYGLQQININVSGKLNLPDTALERLFDVSISGTNEVNVQIKKGSIVKFAGAVGVGNFSNGFPAEGVATYSFVLTPISAPTTDDLGATS